MVFFQQLTTELQGDNKMQKQTVLQIDKINNQLF